MFLYFNAIFQSCNLNNWAVFFNLNLLKHPWSWISILNISLFMCSVCHEEISIKDSRWHLSKCVFFLNITQQIENKLATVAIILWKIRDDIKICYRDCFLIFFKLLISFFSESIHICIQTDATGPIPAHLHHALHILWPAGGSKGQEISAHSKQQHVNKTRMSVLLWSLEKSLNTQADTQ